MPEPARLLALALAARAVALSLRLFGYGWTARTLRRPFVRRSLAPFDPGRVVEVATTGLFPVGCLPRALVTAAILEGQGLDVAVRIGVRRDGEVLSAHAWVEHRGVPFAEPAEITSRFAPFDRNFA